MNFVSRERLEKAKQMDLLTYLQSYEPYELVKLSGNVYSTKTHDSLKISNGKWCWWSRNIGGRSALDYLIKVKGMTLADAVMLIDGRIADIPATIIRQNSEKSADFYLPKRNENNEKVKSYLKGRGIHSVIIDYCLKTERLYEEKRFQNAVFVGFDTEKNPRYACVRGTKGKRFMGEVSGSDKHFSFAISSKEKNNTLHLFESAIDLLSFATLELLEGKDYLLENKLSLAGIYQPRKDVKDTNIPMALEQFLSDHPYIKNIKLHLDNDTKALMVALQNVFEVRVPGFYHCKKEPVLVQCVKFNPELRYTQEELSAHLPEVEPEPEVKNENEPVKHKGEQKGIALVGQRCPFIQHCKKNAATLSEPDWYAMITNLALFEGGVSAIHALSKLYPQYSEKATNAKIAHFYNTGTKPITCAKICGDNGFQCPKHKDGSCKAKAPAALSFFPADAAELAKFLKTSAFKSKGDAAIDVETAQKFINMYMFNITPATAEVFISHNIKDHYKFSTRDIRPLVGFQKQLYSTFSANAEARKAAKQDDIYEWYEPTNRGTLRYAPGIHALSLSKKVHAFYIGGEDWYFYENGYYVKSPESRAEKIILDQMIPLYATKDGIEDCVFQWALRADRYTREVNTNQYIINFENGLFNTQTWELQPHDPKILSTIRIGGSYDPTAKCPLFMKYLSEVLPESEHPLIQEILGYFIVPITKAQKCFVLQGKADSGKSTLLHVVQEVLLRGTENVANLSWNQMSERFGTAQLYGKMANLFADLPSEKIKSTSVFKAITGEDNISGQHKFRTMFSFKPFARLLFSCQDPPQNPNDNSDGFYRRLIIIAFNHAIQEHKKDTDLKEKLMDEQDGILLWALEGLKRLMANKWKFSETDRTRRALNDSTRCTPIMKRSRQDLKSESKLWLCR